MRMSICKYRFSGGFSLAELLAALVIASMVMVATLTIYNRAEYAAASITERLDSSRLADEVLQRIAEDLDTIIAVDPKTKTANVTVTVENTRVGIYPAARLRIVRNYYDIDNRSQTFDTITWQSSVDYDAGDDGLVLYRSHSGLGLEDKLLDEKKEARDRELFIPICHGVTFFEIEALSDKEPAYEWKGSQLPYGLVVSISFAEPVETFTRGLEVRDEDIITRTIAIDRTRKIKFEVTKTIDSEVTTDSGATKTTDRGATKTIDRGARKTIDSDKGGDELRKR